MDATLEGLVAGGAVSSLKIGWNTRSGDGDVTGDEGSTREWVGYVSSEGSIRFGSGEGGVIVTVGTTGASPWVPAVGRVGADGPSSIVGKAGGRPTGSRVLTVASAVSAVAATVSAAGAVGVAVSGPEKAARTARLSPDGCSGNLGVTVGSSASFAFTRFNCS